MLLKTWMTFVSMLASLVAAAPAKNTGATRFQDYGSPTVYVVNNCESTLKVGHSADVEYYGDIVNVAAGSKYTIHPPINWSGRVWGRINCGGQNCFKSGMGSPASLAEFHFMDNGKVFYDISLVDGYNLPMVVEPTIKADALVGTDNRWCAAPTCTSFKCPSGFEVYDDQGNISGCQSACTKFQTDEYCCTGAFDSADTCTTNAYASQIKHTCPDAYSYAYDDATSVYMCTSNAYTVTFC
ncbi:thaumatin [Gilbertella persicaria]|uniref:thaumatin n=1 Tax=Gilbertella persicaria TaxID=101096 RepID=UPI002220796C|nr:thaumatin [Gilbertella persicaria]KAI8062842.1 thaumatin [Gilbertella persicaria]